MGTDSKIQWTHHTFNPWWGCQRVSPGCEHCYAETFDAFVQAKTPHWGPKAPRRFFGEKHWREPLKWNGLALDNLERHRVFCASMADVFEDRPELAPWRLRLFDLIRKTPALDWLLLTKRPERILKGIGEAMCCVRGNVDIFDETLIWLSELLAGKPLPNVWFGATVEDRERTSRIAALRAVPAVVHFISCEPLLERIKPPLTGIDWVIVGGESGPGARPFEAAWAWELVKQCSAEGVACFVKQMGAHTIDRNDAGFNGEDEYGWHSAVEYGGEIRVEELDTGYQGAPVRVHLRDKHGGDLAEWPLALRVREFPEVAGG